MNTTFNRHTAGRARLAAILLASTGLAGAVTVPTAATAQAAEAARSYEIPAGSLADALNSFAEQSGAQLLYEAELTQGRRSEGLHGRFTRAEGLSRLLMGGGLAARQTSVNVFSIKLATSGSMTLDPVRVRGASVADGSPDRAVIERARVNGAVDTIIVTGRRVTEINLGTLGPKDILSTPYIVSTITQDLIALHQLRTLDALARIDPAVQVGYKGWYSSVILRGFDVSGDGVRLNGSPIGLSSRFPFEFLDRIEIQKGATGFLYGFVPPGGIVDHILKSPTAEPRYEAALSFTSPSNFLGRVDVSHRAAGDIVGLRAQGFAERGRTDNDGYDIRRSGAALAGDWKPSDTLKVNADFFYQDFRSTGSGLKQLFYFSPGVISLPIEAFRESSRKWEFNHVKTFSFGGSIEWAFATDWTATLSGRLLRQPIIANKTAAIPADAVNADYFNIQSSDSYDANSAQLRLVGHFFTGAAKHNVVIAADIFSTPQSSAPVVFSYVGRYKIVDNPEIPPIALQIAGSRYRAAERVQSSFVAADTIDIGRWSILAALRGTHYRQDSLSSTGVVTARYNVDRLLPSVGLTWRITDHVSLYGNYALGLEQGATAPTQASNANQVLAPVKSTQYEVGAKARIGNGLLLSAALFQIERDYQYLDLTTALPIFTANGTQRHRGVEFSFSGAATDRLTLFGGFTLLDPKIINVNGSLAGQSPAGVAKRQASFQAEYRLTDGFFINGGVLYTGPRPVFISNSASVAGFTLFDLGARVETKVAGHPVSLAAGVENLFDENYWAGAQSSVLSLGTPRLVRLTLTGRF